MRVYHFLLLLVVISITSCRFFGGERISGDGNITSKKLSPGSFSGIDVSGAIKVYVKQEAANEVTIQADDNLHDYLEVYTEGDILVVETAKGYNLDPSTDIKIFVSAPSYNSLKVSGASEIIGMGQIRGTGELVVEGSGASVISLNVHLPRLTTEVSGASEVDLKGQVTDFRMEASGSSTLRALDLVTENSELDLSGASEAKITANRSLKLEASGASTVDYRGNAAVTQKVSGAGSVTRIN